ncbi:ty3-gypsy retrotransposon protein [Cucumis melo var. makuwa]|uniref:Ty3-gypsy retrotransposon protein n=1 Tax=Cucumis melo var. makuwa TaxID=1194695 RepID=A0A5D3C7E8_CUCMM|nr:ty3-gypsy retrotransposon protein [Cucumis melo var. makuwa]TYK07897.1 ty3-gypsy retrotransposon protein [Cucumis melo var. makuwa]
MFVVKANNEELEIIEEADPESKELSVVELAKESKAIVELSINSVVALSNPEKLLDALRLATKDISHYGVILGSGTAIKGKGVCEAVELSFNEWKIVANFLPLELGGVDVILGMQWLYSLGITEVDWKNLTMTFLHQGKKVVIKGDPSLTKTRVNEKYDENLG